MGDGSESAEFRTKGSLERDVEEYRQRIDGTMGRIRSQRALGDFSGLNRSIALCQANLESAVFLPFPTLPTFPPPNARI